MITIELDRYYKKCTSIYYTDNNAKDIIKNCNHHYMLGRTKQLHVCNLPLFLDYIRKYNKAHEEKVCIRANFDIPEDLECRRFH